MRSRRGAHQAPSAARSAASAERAPQRRAQPRRRARRPAGAVRRAGTGAARHAPACRSRPRRSPGPAGPAAAAAGRGGRGWRRGRAARSRSRSRSAGAGAARPAGTARGGRTGRGPPSGWSSAARPGRRPDAPAAPALALQEHLQPRQPARRHGGRAVAAARAGQHDLGAAQAAWRRNRAPPGRPPPPARPGRPRGASAGTARGRDRPRRPDALDQPAQHHHVDRLQPRLQQAPDEHARMLGRRRRRAAPGGCAPPSPSSTASSRPGSTPRGWSGSTGSAACTAASAVASASPSSPAHSRAGRACRRWRRGVRPPRSAPASIVGGGGVDGGGDAQGRLQAGLHPVQQVAAAAGRPGQGRSRAARAARPRAQSTLAQPGQPRRGRGPRRRPAPARARPARQAAGARPAAASGCFSSASSGTGASCSAIAAAEQAQEHRGRRFGERLAGAVVGHHAVAQQFGADPAGQVAVRRDQRGARARRFQRVAQHQRDGGGFLLLVGRGQAPARRVDGGGRPRRPTSRRALRGQQRAAERQRCPAAARG